MRGFMIILLICSVTMSALALSYMAFTPFLAKRYSPKGRYYAWLIVVIGLIIPFRPEFNHPFVKLIPTGTTMPMIEFGNGTQLVGPNVNPMPPAASLNISLTWWQISAAVWLIGMAVFFLYHLVKHARFIEMTRRWSKEIADTETVQLFQGVKTELGISKEIELLGCECVGTPMLVGFTHPRILLPNTIFAKDELRFILKHELIHFKRKDLWYKCLVLFAAAIHWFNPVLRLIAREIDIQCEISCDDEVVSRTDAETRQQYSEAIIGVVKYQSQMKTALSTNFYGGKQGMKKRIFSIMDMRNKKAGIALLCAVLIFTFGTGFAFAAKEETNGQPEYIKEDIAVSPDSSYGYRFLPDSAYGYRFLPDPDVYAKYSAYGVAISDDGKTLLYNGQKIRLFVDEYSDVEAFYYDDAGAVRISVVRDSSGKITGMKTISEETAQKFYTTFFADDMSSGAGASETKDDKKVEADTGTKYEQYAPYGITYHAKENSVYFNGQRVRLFVDERGGSFYTFWTDDAGTVDLSVVRNSSGQITEIETISKEKAQAYIAAANKSEQDVLNGLEEKVAERIKERYPEN